jgi:hypothetical protein
MSPALYPAHCRERSAESCGSSHATPASPSGRTGFSSRGSRHVLECSSAHWGPCMPSRVPSMTPAVGLAHRIGDSTSLRLLYLSNTLFRPECSSRGEPHSPFTRPRLHAQCHRHCPVSLECGTRDRGNKPGFPMQIRVFSADPEGPCLQSMQEQADLDRLFLLIHSASAPGG